MYACGMYFMHLVCNENKSGRKTFGDVKMNLNSIQFKVRLYYLYNV